MQIRRNIYPYLTKSWHTIETASDNWTDKW
jgi:hypothetical protein